MSHTPDPRPTHAERFDLAAAAVRGAIAGAVKAIVTWLLEQLTH